MIQNGFYKHYKGHLVKVIGVAKHSETLQDLVIYDHLGTNDVSDIWVRPLDMFCEEAVIDGVRAPRFAWIGESLDKIK